jgi:ribonuclease G
VKEVVRQLRLRDIGGIIVIDFIDMANPKNRETVEEALRTELERDRTKTYVVEISPLGLVEMTRQNVTEGPREVMTRKCPTCGGDGIVYSEASAAIDVERRLRALVSGSRSQAFRVELAAPIAAALIGPGASRLRELESLTKRRFFLTGKPDMHSDHFVVLSEGKLADVAPAGPVEEGAEIMVELVKVDRHDGSAAVGKLDGIDVCVGDAAELVGKKVKVKVERVFDGVAYGSLARKAGKRPSEPLTAEAEAEKPTRKPPARKADAEAVEAEAPESADAEEEPGEETETEGAAAMPAKKKTRRGTRGGRNRKKKPAAAAIDVGEETPEEEQPAKTVTIHLPPADLGEEEEVEAEPGPEAASEDGDQPAAAPTRKKTRRGSRGGKNRRKREAVAAAETNGGEETPAAPERPEPLVAAETDGGEEAPAPQEEPEENWDYVPMSQWGDEFE